jgi:hypothetical protein
MPPRVVADAAHDVLAHGQPGKGSDQSRALDDNTVEKLELYANRSPV